VIEGAVRAVVVVEVEVRLERLDHRQGGRSVNPNHITLLCSLMTPGDMGPSTLRHTNNRSL
jgi:hypothetical protein